MRARGEPRVGHRVWRRSLVRPASLRRHGSGGDGNKYRADIDGLRALAVLPVVLFHYGASAVSGGFVGVDIFFVISGYLISGIIMTDLDQGRYSILGFYERRVSRIVPALIALLLVCTIARAVVLFPTDSPITARVCARHCRSSRTSTSGRIPTILRAPPRGNPCCIPGRWGSKSSSTSCSRCCSGRSGGWGDRCRISAVLMFALSLLVSVYAAARMPVFGFYIPVTRAYELLLGFFVAFAPRFRFPELPGQRCRSLACLPSWAPSSSSTGIRRFRVGRRWFRRSVRRC